MPENENFAVVENLLKTQREDGELDAGERGLFESIQKKQKNPEDFKKFVRDYLSHKHNGIDHRQQQFVLDNLNAQLSNLGVEHDKEKEAALYRLRTQIAILREDRDADTKEIPGVEMDKRAADAEVLKKESKENADVQALDRALKEAGHDMEIEDRNGVIVLRPKSDVAKTDFLSRLDGESFVALSGVAVFTASALASMAGGQGGLSHSLMLGTGAVLSGNYLKNQIAPEGIPDSANEIGKQKIQELADKWGVDYDFVDNNLSKGAYAFYSSYFGKHTPENGFTPLTEEVKKIHREFYNDAFNPYKLNTAFHQANSEVPWRNDMSNASKLEWLKSFAKNNAAQDTNIDIYKQLLDENGRYYDYVTQASGIVDNLHYMICKLQERAVTTNTRKNAFVGIGQVVDDAFNDGVFHKMFS